jgi:hypothetical protein
LQLTKNKQKAPGKHHNEHSQQTTNEQTNEKKKQRHTPLLPPRTITRSPVE